MVVTCKTLNYLYSYHLYHLYHLSHVRMAAI